MNNNVIEIKKTELQELYKVLTNYPAISKEQVQHEMHKVFGEDTFKPQDVTERIKTFDDAYRELGEEHPFIKEYDALQKADEVLFGGLSMDIVAYLKLRIICAALNEGWEPKFTEDEVRWFPWFWLYTQDEINNMDEREKKDRHLISTGDYETGYAGFASAYSISAPSNTSTYIGSRLCLKSEALAVYCGKQFIDLWADFNLVRRR